MTRGIAEFDPIRELVPEWAAIVVALLTQLGDVWFLTLLVGGFYLYRTDDREEGAVLVGLLLAGFGILLALKYAFALPRPDRTLVQLETLPAVVRPLYEATGTADGYGFPSGHAFMTTVVYVSLAGRLSIGTARQRLLGAATVIAVVCLSRVALGVHYLVDVAAGAAGGLLLVLAAEWLLDRYAADRGTAAFALAVLASASAALIASDDPDAVLLLGASLGAFGGWQLVRLGERLPERDRDRRSRSRTDRRPAIRIGLAIGAFAPLAGALVYFGLVSMPVPAASGALGFGLAAVLAAPVLHTLRSRPSGI
ncbi:phosphatase PAP2 family protein [Halopiger xanaduensis]|uniref:Phosphoesterase PA-phosphatase related protein n=1 Tax=Halopiger xanaduensis (strain DSM 18323 / JCM 14033 / SH-6) TaxID=797210 RepID=F8DBW1_HALXS|nr:phosphatase PAP2 family protein [Halopiger xanaduensis]AEH35937.1 phosphoesterase PA-phosphatase related protein [Halopiger xanaduensis SH-6]